MPQLSLPFGCQVAVEQSRSLLPDIQTGSDGTRPPRAARALRRSAELFQPCKEARFSALQQKSGQARASAKNSNTLYFFYPYQVCFFSG